MATRIRTYPGTRKPVARDAADALTCLQLFENLSAYVDDELSEDICRAVRRHLKQCPNCDRFLGSFRHVVELCRVHASPALTAGDRLAIRRRILKTAASA